DNGVFNDVVGQQTYRGEGLGDVLTRMANLLPDVHRVTVLPFHLRGRKVSVASSCICLVGLV
ncbi:MAG: hypothetical protein WBW27_25445, partial [Pseudolabrys sp.]